jgi:HlyD family secretion protein
VLEAKLKQALAAKELAARQIEISSIKAPVEGVVLRKNFEVGEMVNPGTRVLTLADLNNLWVTVYIPETDLGRVQLGQRSMVRVDAFPRDTFKGEVVFIAPEAEFTPKNVVTVSERVKTVFAVKVALGSGNGKLKPGMPADVVFLPVGE